MVSFRRLQNAKFKKGIKLECVYCGCHNEMFLDIDHIIPKCRGGKDIPANKQITCMLCNRLKGGLTHEEFLTYMDYITKLYKMRRLTFQVGWPTITHVHNLFPLDEPVEEVKEAKADEGRVTPDEG